MKLVILVNTRYFQKYSVFSKNLIWSSQSDRSDRSDRVNPIELIRSSRFVQKWLPGQILKIIHFCTLFDPIELIRSEMAFWPNFKLFRPKLSPNWNKNGKNPSFPPKTCVFSLKTCVFVTSEGQKTIIFVICFV
jgi:hypothetical protein